MWIQKSRGKLRAYERYTDLDGKKHKVSVPIAKDTAKERKRAYAELLEKINAADDMVENVRFDKLVEKYCSRKEIKESSRIKYHSIYKMISKILGNPYVCSINSALIRRKFTDADLKATTYNRYIDMLKGILKYAREMGYLDKDIVMSRVKDDKTITIEEQYLTSEELSEVLKLLEGSPYYFLFKFMALSGCRIGEAVALNVSDIDGDYIHITKTYSVRRMQTPKTATSNRDIYMQAELKEFINEYLKHRNLLLIAKGTRTDILFFGAKGGYIPIDYASNQLSKLDFPKHLHSHIFRHTHASLLAEQGYSLDAISRRLGHSTSIITKKIYLHVTEKVRKRDEEKLKEIRLLS